MAKKNFGCSFVIAEKPLRFKIFSSMNYPDSNRSNMSKCKCWRNFSKFDIKITDQSSHITAYVELLYCKSSLGYFLLNSYNRLLFQDCPLQISLLPELRSHRQRHLEEELRCVFSHLADILVSNACIKEAYNF